MNKNGPVMEIIDEIKHVISKSLKVPVDQLKDDSKLEELGAESLDVIEIVFQIEEKFNVDITMRASKNSLIVGAEKDDKQLDEVALMTIGDIARAVKLLVESKGA
jgi:acyl carrier protein